MCNLTSFIPVPFFPPGTYSNSAVLLAAQKLRWHIVPHTKSTKGPLTGPTSPQAAKQPNMIFMMFLSIGVPVFWLHSVDHRLVGISCFFCFFNTGNEITQVISAECNVRLALSALVGLIKFKAHEESTQGETDKSVLSVSTVWWAMIMTEGTEEAASYAEFTLLFHVVTHSSMKSLQADYTLWKQGKHRDEIWMSSLCQLSWKGKSNRELLSLQASLPLAFHGFLPKQIRKAFLSSWRHSKLSPVHQFTSSTSNAPLPPPPPPPLFSRKKLKQIQAPSQTHQIVPSTAASRPANNGALSLKAPAEGNVAKILN